MIPLSLSLSLSDDEEVQTTFDSNQLVEWSIISFMNSSLYSWVVDSWSWINQFSCTSIGLDDHDHGSDGPFLRGIGLWPIPASFLLDAAKETSEPYVRATKKQDMFDTNTHLCFQISIIDCPGAWIPHCLPIFREIGGKQVQVWCNLRVRCVMQACMALVRYFILLWKAGVPCFESSLSPARCICILCHLMMMAGIVILLWIVIILDFLLCCFSSF